MSENKEYISQIQENGAVHISEDVLISITASAASEVDGVAGLASGRVGEIAEMLGKKNAGKAVRVTIGEDDSLSIDCSIVVLVGVNVLEVATAAQEAIASSVESVTGIKAADVNVTVAGIAAPKEQKTKELKK